MVGCFTHLFTYMVAICRRIRDTVSLVPAIHSGKTYIASVVTGVQPNMDKLTCIVITAAVVDRLDELTASSVVVVCPIMPVLMHENDFPLLLSASKTHVLALMLVELKHIFDMKQLLRLFTSATLLLIVLFSLNWLSYTIRSSRQNLSDIYVIGKNASLPTRAPIHCTYSTCFDASLCAYEHSGRSLNRISVYVYNPVVYFDESLRPLSLYPSHEQVDMLTAIRNSRYWVNDPLEACVFVPNVDLLNGLNPSDRLARITLNSLLWWNGGVNHLLFSFLPGKHNVFCGSAINANAAHSTVTYRSTFDISIPAFHPSFPTTGLRIRDTQRSFLLSVLPTYSASDRTRVRDILFAYRKPDFLENQSIILFDSAGDLSSTTFADYNALFSSTQYATVDRITVNYAETLTRSLFCLIVRIPPVGQLALFDAMAAGCIPVIVDDSFVLPFSEVLDWTKIAVRVRHADLEQTPTILTSFRSTEIARLQSQVQFIFNRYFSSLEKIVLTTLDILNERVFPYYSRTYFQWNDPNYVENEFPSPPSLFYPTRSSTDIGFTALIRGHDHFALLRRLLMDLHLVPSLRRIIVVWTNPNVSIPSASLWPSLRVPLSIVPVDQPSRRFFPHAQISTEAVLSLDDHACAPPLAQIQLAFELWSQNIDRLIGITLAHTLPTNYSAMTTDNETTLLLSATFGASLFHKYYLHAYTELLSNPLTKLVNEINSCEEPVFNWLIVQLSGKPVLTVLPQLSPRSVKQDEPGACHSRALHECLHSFRQARMHLDSVLSRGRPFQIDSWTVTSLE
ncbi:glucuronyl/N-acetylglucosaminyl transferase EXT2 [Paragonimus westermani]|uniref:Glucuronyl/N-acetylglucosaminyl transferase EXT2 n=1 Tax=Paragonimus westermani TaxID=34504 RepID=A0A5J4NUK5_9TREM|nr:glucuronyl/N-acetylglucosaminyl transferase EXT2 [Paragonimus westermani]